MWDAKDTHTEPETRQGNDMENYRNCDHDYDVRYYPLTKNIEIMCSKCYVYVGGVELAEKLKNEINECTSSLVTS